MRRAITIATACASTSISCVCRCSDEVDTSYGRAGGHAGVLFSSTKVFKPFQSRGRTEREVKFYESMAQLGVASKHISAFYGTLVRDDKPYLCLSNICEGMDAPQVMDLKVGPAIWPEGAPSWRVVREIKNFPHQFAHGFRICGIRLFHTDENGYTLVPRQQCRHLSMGQVEELLWKYFSVNGTVRRYDIVKLFIQELQQVIDWARSGPQISFRGASLLFAFDVKSEEPFVRIHIIDFSHAQWGERVAPVDDNFICGCERVMATLQRLAAEEGSVGLKS